MILFRKKLNPLKLLQKFAKEFRKFRTASLHETEKFKEMAMINTMLCELIKENDQFIRDILKSIETNYSSNEVCNLKANKTEQ